MAYRSRRKMFRKGRPSKGRGRRRGRKGRGKRLGTYSMSRGGIRL